MAWNNYSDNASISLLSDVERPIIGTLLALIGTSAFFGNALVILAFALSRKLHNTTNYFVVNLSVADLITSMSIPVNVVAVTSPQHLPGWLCIWCGFFSVACVGCSVYTLACIAAYRLIVVASNRQWRMSNSYKPVVIAIILTWTIPITMASLPLIFGLGEFGYNTKYSSCTWTSNNEASYDYSLILAATYYPIPMVIIIASYIKIFLHLRDVRRRINMAQNAERRASERQVQQVPHGVHKRQANVTKNMFYVVCAFLVCMTPYTVALISPDSDFFIPYAAVILMLSSTLNPTIYATKHPDFSKVMRNVAACNFNKIPHFVFR